MNEPARIVDVSDLFAGRRAPFIERHGGATVEHGRAVLLAETPGSLEPQPAPRKARVSVLLDGPHRRSTWWGRLKRWLREGFGE